MDALEEAKQRLWDADRDIRDLFLAFEEALTATLDGVEVVVPVTSLENLVFGKWKSKRWRLMYERGRQRKPFQDCSGTWLVLALEIGIPNMVENIVALIDAQVARRAALIHNSRVLLTTMQATAEAE